MKSLAQYLGRFALCFYALGLRSATKFFLRKIQNKFSLKGRLVSLTTPLADFDLAARVGSSDLDVFHQIFIQREYRNFVPTENEIKWVVDCGGNVGYSAAYFASRFPRASIVSVEPDPENFAILEKNVKPYLGRIMILRGGVWHSDSRIKLVRGEFGDGREWATQTRIVHGEEEADVDVYSINSIMSRFNIDVVDILKIDIEGAELELFGSRVSNWLPYVNHLVIELHDAESEECFYRALKNTEYLFTFKTDGELTFASKVGLA